MNHELNYDDLLILKTEKCVHLHVIHRSLNEYQNSPAITWQHLGIHCIQSGLLLQTLPKTMHFDLLNILVSLFHFLLCVFIIQCSRLASVSPQSHLVMDKRLLPKAASSNSTTQLPHLFWWGAKVGGWIFNQILYNCFWVDWKWSEPIWSEHKHMPPYFSCS